MTIIAVGSDPAEFEGTHIAFRLDERAGAPGRKTMIWNISAKAGDQLGQVGWFARWRKYCFFPAPNCVFEETCLLDIAQFIIERTAEHKGKKAI